MFILFLLSFLTTFALRQYAITKNVLDIPNHRSTHSIPTPRGGGLSFVIVFLIALLYFGYKGIFPASTIKAFAIGGFGIASIGFLDDHLSLSAKYRLIAHFLISAASLTLLGGMPTITIFTWIIPADTLLLNIAAVFFLVWFLNLYNFMDGINGLASIEAITICLSGAFLYYHQQNATAMVLPLILTSAVAGFLCWNFPKARIFMGDAGSGFLGLIIGLLTIQAAQFNPNLFWCWLILSGVFVVDATVTLFARLIKKEAIYQAHRSHAYQRATDIFKSHTKVTLTVMGINLFWLLPWAYAVNSNLVNESAGLIMAYIPLVILVLTLRKNK